MLRRGDCTGRGGEVNHAAEERREGARAWLHWQFAQAREVSGARESIAIAKSETARCVALGCIAGAPVASSSPSPTFRRSGASASANNWPAAHLSPSMD